MGAKSLQSCLTLCDLMDYSPSGFSVHGILQARILEWVAISSSRDLPKPGIEPLSLRFSALAAGFFTTSAIWEALVLQMHCSNPVFTCHSSCASSHCHPSVSLSVAKSPFS